MKLDEHLIGRISRERKEPTWLRDMRTGAVRVFNACHIPAEQVLLLERTLPDCMRVFSHSGGSRGESCRRVRLGGSRGALFCGLAQALKLNGRLLRGYLARDSKSDGGLAAFNAALWSDGVFLHVPQGVRIENPVQSELLRAPSFLPVEKIVIAADKGAKVHFIEGCTARLGAGELRVSSVDLRVGAGATLRFTTLQNLPGDMVNLTVKRAEVGAGALLKWIDVNPGSRRTVKRPVIMLAGRGAQAQFFSCALAGPDRRHDLGAEFHFQAAETKAEFSSRAVVFAEGLVSTTVEAARGSSAKGASLEANSSALALDARSRARFSLPAAGSRGGLTVKSSRSSSRLDAKRLFYLTSRGLDRARATALIVNGFLESVARELPLEFAVELSRLVEIELAEEAAGIV